MKAVVRGWLRDSGVPEFRGRKGDAGDDAGKYGTVFPTPPGLLPGNRTALSKGQGAL